MQRTLIGQVFILMTGAIAISPAFAAIMDLNHVKLVEQDDSRLVATSNYNYAIVSPQLLTKNWRTVSVNGDKVLIITTTNEVISKTRSEMTELDRQFLESLRDEIGSGGAQSFEYSTSMGGSSGSGRAMMMSSNSGGGLSSSFSSSSTSNSIQQNSSGGGVSVNVRDDSNFSVSKSDLPYNWSTIFVNGDLVTLIYRDGEVEMRPLSSLEAERLAAVNQVKGDLKEMQKTQEQQISNTMQHSIDMVSNVFNNIMGRFPTPPSYKTAVGNMFGDNFPFGPNNSPFSSASGWPFGGGAFAFAGRR